MGNKYLYDCDDEFEQWWEENGDNVEGFSDKEMARAAYSAGANMERCPHNDTTMAKSRDWCHDCNSWVHRS